MEHGCQTRAEVSEQCHWILEMGKRFRKHWHDIVEQADIASLFLREGSDISVVARIQRQEDGLHTEIVNGDMYERFEQWQALNTHAARAETFYIPHRLQPADHTSRVGNRKQYSARKRKEIQAENTKANFTGRINDETDETHQR